MSAAASVVVKEKIERDALSKLKVSKPKKYHCLVRFLTGLRLLSLGQVWEALVLPLLCS